MNAQPEINLDSWVYDDATLPEAAECEDCGDLVAWAWWSPSPDRLASGIPRALLEECWRLERCPCRDRTDVVSAVELHEAAVARARVPEGLHDRSLHRLVVAPDDPEEVPGWARRVARARTRHLGVASMAVQEAIEVCKDWRPVMGGPWLYIDGPYGHGKSQLAAALISDLLRPKDATWTGPEGPSRPGARTLSRPKRTDVQWWHEMDLYQAQKDAWRGATDSFFQACYAEVLVVDEWGIEGGHDHLRRMRRQIVRARIEGRPDMGLQGLRPTILISNTSWDEIAPQEAVRGKEPAFGPRLASRLRQHCIHLHVEGIDWRQASGR